MKPARKKAVRPTREPATEPTVPYLPTATERAALAAFDERRTSRRPAPAVRIVKDARTGTVNLSADHPDQDTGLRLLMEAMGVCSGATLEALLGQLANSGGGQPNERELRQKVSMAIGIAPRDTIEAMLAAQMAAAHSLTMNFARRLNQAENTLQQDSAANAFNKLARTFAVQTDTLKRYRSSGEQTMRVEHVTVQAGGQAIVGTVNRGEGGDGKK